MSSTRRWITAAVVVLLVAAMAIYISGRREELASLERISLGVLLVTGLLQFGAQASLNGSLLLPLRRSMAALGFWELYLVRTGGLLAGSVLPVAGGPGVRLAYLRGRGLSTRDFVWATLFSNTLGLAAAAALSVVALAVLWARAGRPNDAVLAVTGGVAALSLAIALGVEYLPRVTHAGWLRRWFPHAPHPIETTSPLAVRVFGLALARHVLNFVTFGLLYTALSGVQSAFLTGGLVYALTSPVRIVHITPGNIGIAISVFDSRPNTMNVRKYFSCTASRPRFTWSSVAASTSTIDSTISATVSWSEVKNRRTEEMGRMAQRVFTERRNATNAAFSATTP